MCEPHMFVLDAKGEERLQRLERRALWLTYRINTGSRDSGFDHAERSALDWAIRTIRTLAGLKTEG